MQEIKKGWKEVKLGEVINVISGYAFKAKDFQDTGIPVIKIKNIKEGFTDIGGDTQHVNIDFKLDEKFIISKGDILISLTGSHISQWSSVVGRVGKYGYENISFLNQRAGKVFCKNINKEFIYFLLFSIKVRYRLASLANGAASQANISPSDIHGLQVIIPKNIKIQQKIASVLSKYDDLIENNNKRIKLLEESAQAIYEEWFVRYKFPGSEEVKMVESGNEDFGRIPEGWKVKILNDLDIQYLGRGVTPKYEVGSGIYALNQKVNKGTHLELQYLKELKNDLVVPDQKKCYNGDVLINSLGEGTIGRIHYFKGYDKEYAIDQHMSIFRSNYRGYSQIVYFYLSSKEGQGRLQGIKKGGTNMTMLNISDIRNFSIVVPSKEILDLFSTYLGGLFDEILNLQKQNQKLKETRDLLIPRLVGGELDVDSLDIC